MTGLNERTTPANIGISGSNMVPSIPMRMGQRAFMLCRANPKGLQLQSDTRANLAPTCREHHGEECCIQSSHMRRLRGKHVVQGKVHHIEETKHRLPAQAHGQQLVGDDCREVLDYAQGVELACMT